jgi:hypothetical protein
MNLRHRPALLALLLVLGCVLLRLASNLYPAVLPNFTPLVALAFVGAVYLPHRWSWLLGVAAILLSEAAFLNWNVSAGGRMFSPMMLVTLGFYALMGGLGVGLARYKSLVLLFAGPILGSIFFYLVTNTFCWWASFHAPVIMPYPVTWAGWVQANTEGLPGYLPTWAFLRNGIVGDVVFTLILLAIFEPSLLTRSAGVKTAPVRT